MDAVLEKTYELGIVPVVKLEKVDDALPLGKALISGDLPIAEVTFRTDAAEESIRRLTSQLPDLFVGAGTVLSTEQAERAIKAGAKFIVSPGFNPEVVDFCIQQRVTVIPGINSPTQIEMGLARGLTVMKFFPAEASGGVAMLKALAAPYGGVRYIPTGGVNEKNLASYLALPQVLACGGSWMVSPELISAGRFDEVTRLSRQAVLSMLGFEFLHLGINEATASDAAHTVKQFTDLFSFPVREVSGSYFVDERFEVLKSPNRGAHGHIAIRTSSVTRAVAYLKRHGYSTVPETERRAGGDLEFVYLKEEISGFAVHLIKKP